MNKQELRLAVLDRALDTARATVTDKFGPQDIQAEYVITIAEKYLTFVSAVEDAAVLEDQLTYG
jgi:hypothetical protein